MSTRRRGMDHGHYPYSPIPKRKRLQWPGGAKLAFWAVVYLEYWEPYPLVDSIRPPDVQGPWPVIPPDHRTGSHREYGSRVGIFRVMDTLDRNDIRATLAVNAAACERYPFVIEEALKRKWEIAAHGTDSSRIISSRMTEEAERAHIRESLEAVRRVTKSAVNGWFGQDFSESARTPKLVAEAGFQYMADWPNDDQPYAMTVGRPLVSMPQHAEWDDVLLMWVRQVPPHRYPGIIDDACACLLQDSGESGRLLGIGVHPWMLGQASRIRYLDEALQRVARRGSTWNATAGEIVDSFLAQQR